MEHTLNRQTTTILTYINQGRRPVAFPVSLPVRPAVGPVRGHAGPAAQPSVSARGLCPSVSVRAPGAPPAGRMDG